MKLLLESDPDAWLTSTELEAFVLYRTRCERIRWDGNPLGDARASTRGRGRTVLLPRPIAVGLTDRYDGGACCGQGES
jgi:hypothetical protein